MNYFLLAANGILLALTAFKFNSLPPIIPLFYSRAPQEAQLTPWWMIFIVPISMNIMYVVNKRLVKTMFSGNDFIIQFMKYLNVIIVLAFTFIFIKILFLIT